MAVNDLQNAHTRTHARTHDMVSGHWPMNTQTQKWEKHRMDSTIHASDTASALTATKTRRINYIERERILVTRKTQLE